MVWMNGQIIRSEGKCAPNCSASPMAIGGFVHSEPIPRNTAIFSQTFQRLVGAAREKGSTPNNMATQLVEWGLNQIEAGEITFGHNQMEGGEA
jgi:hypothetical protein